MRTSPLTLLFWAIVAAFILYINFSQDSASDKSRFKLKNSAIPSVTPNPANAKQSYLVNITVSSTIGVGVVVVEVHRQWAPAGAQRFFELVNSSYYDEAKFFRVLKKFMAQVGVNKDPAITKLWRKKYIPDDPSAVSNKRGTLSFASSGKDTRCTQFFFNFVDNSYLDNGFFPFGHVVSGMEYIDALYMDYGEGGKGDGSDGKGPNQGKITNRGNTYLDQYFPKLSHIITAKVID